MSNFSNTTNRKNISTFLYTFFVSKIIILYEIIVLCSNLNLNFLIYLLFKLF
jgi:hypothetical protein